MPSGTFKKSTNTFVMAAGSFPSWWPSRNPSPITCTKTSTRHLGCGCVQHSTTIHCSTCVHPPVITTQDWGRAIVTIEQCKNLETTHALKDDTCSVCKIYGILQPLLLTDRNAAWNSMTPEQYVNIKTLYERRIALQDAARAKERHLAIYNAWLSHTKQLSDRGVLELQPNVRAMEDGVVYTLLIEKIGRAVQVSTRSKTMEDWEKAEKEKKIMEKHYLLDGVSSKQSYINSVSPAPSGKLSSAAAPGEKQQGHYFRETIHPWSEMMRR